MGAQKNLTSAGQMNCPCGKPCGLDAPDGAARCRSRGQKQASHALGFMTTFTSLFLTTMVLTTCMVSSILATLSRAKAASTQV